MGNSSGVDKSQLVEKPIDPKVFKKNNFFFKSNKRNTKRCNETGYQAVFIDENQSQNKLKHGLEFTNKPKITNVNIIDIPKLILQRNSGDTYKIKQSNQCLEIDEEKVKIIISNGIFSGFFNRRIEISEIPDNCLEDDL